MVPVAERLGAGLGVDDGPEHHSHGDLPCRLEALDRPPDRGDRVEVREGLTPLVSGPERGGYPVVVLAAEPSAVRVGLLGAQTSVALGLALL